MNSLFKFILLTALLLPNLSSGVEIRSERDYLIVYHEVVAHFKNFNVTVKPGIYLSPREIVARRSDLKRLIGGGTMKAEFSGGEKVDMAIGFASGQAGNSTRGEVWAANDGQYFLLEKDGVDQRVARAVPRKVIPAVDGFFVITKSWKPVYIPHVRKNPKDKYKAGGESPLTSDERWQYYALTRDGKGLIYLTEDLKVAIVDNKGNEKTFTKVTEDPRNGPVVALSGDGFFTKNGDQVLFTPLDRFGNPQPQRVILANKQAHEQIVFIKNNPYIISMETTGGRVRLALTSTGQIVDANAKNRIRKLTSKELNNLRKVGENWSDLASSGMFTNIYDRKEYVDPVFRALGSKKNTCAHVVGPLGAGKTSFLKTFSKSVSLARAPGQYWEDYEVFSFKLSDLMKLEAETEIEMSEDPDAENKFGNLLDQIRNKKVILLLDDFLDDPFLGTTNFQKAFDKFNEYFREDIVNGKIKVVTSIDSVIWGGLVKAMPIVKEWCDVVHLQSPTKNELIAIIEMALDELADRYKIEFESGVANEIAKMASEAYQEKAEPRRSILVAEDISRGYSLKKGHDRKVTVQYTRNYFLNKVLGLENVSDFDYNAFVDMIDTELIGQEDAKQKIIDEIGAFDLAATALDRPIATLFMIGPTGVGKSFSSQLITKGFPSLPKVEIDMNFFGGFDKDQKLSSSLARYKNQPFFLILDDLDKAPQPLETLKKLRGIIDTGIYAKGTDRELNFRTAIILISSNHGQEIILKSKPEESIFEIKSKVANYVMDENSPDSQRIPREVWSRIESTLVIFRPLTGENLVELAHKFQNELVSEIQGNYGINVLIQPGLICATVAMVKNTGLGAVPLRNRITLELKKAVANHIRRIEGKDRQLLNSDSPNFISEILVKHSSSGRIIVTDSSQTNYQSVKQNAMSGNQACDLGDN